MTTTPWMFWHPALLHMYSYIISNLNNTIPIARPSGTHFKDHWKITMAFIFYLFLTEEFMLKIFFHPQKVCYDRFWMDDAWLGNICHMRKILKIFSKVFMLCLVCILCADYLYNKFNLCCWNFFETPISEFSNLYFDPLKLGLIFAKLGA